MGILYRKARKGKTQCSQSLSFSLALFVLTNNYITLRTFRLKHLLSDPYITIPYFIPVILQRYFSFFEGSESGPGRKFTFRD